MNFIIVGNNVDNIAMTIWTTNTNYMILNKSPNIWTKDFEKFIENKQILVCSTAQQFENKDVDSTIERLKKLNFIPLFVADNEKSIENNMYFGVNDKIPSAILFQRNEKNECYDEFIKIAKNYLLGKGIVIKDDKVIRTPRKRKRTTIKE